jgi:hypothetical protein
MEGIEKPHTDKYKEITNDWNYDASCTLTSLLVWDLENFKRLIFVVQSSQFVTECKDLIKQNYVSYRMEYPIQVMSISLGYPGHSSQGVNKIVTYITM